MIKQNGLSELITTLKQDGYSEDTIDIVFETVGGFHDFQRMSAWAFEHYGEEELEKQYAFEPTDPEAVKENIERLHRTWILANDDIFKAEAERSFVWFSRLNSTVCNLWSSASKTNLAVEMCEKRGLKFSDALEVASEEVNVPPLPDCRYSDNEDGRINASWYGKAGIGMSCFYTVDSNGIAACKEFPHEHIDLSDYNTMLTIAATIYRDLTSCADDDVGLSGALLACQDEPEWRGGNLFKLTGEALIEKIRSLVNEKNDISKSWLAVKCGYIHRNGLPDFVGFYKALLVTQGRDPNEESDAPEMSEEKREGIYAEIREELFEYAEQSVQGEQMT